MAFSYLTSLTAEVRASVWVQLLSSRPVFMSSVWFACEKRSFLILIHDCPEPVLVKTHRWSVDSVTGEIRNQTSEVRFS